MATPDSTGPIIVQSDGSLLLDVHSQGAEDARSEISAFAELEKAGKIDPRNPEVQGEMAITRRACIAERTLGRSELNC